MDRLLQDDLQGAFAQTEYPGAIWVRGQVNQARYKNRNFLLNLIKKCYHIMRNYKINELSLF